MRSETETNREVNRNESVLLGNQQEVHLNNTSEQVPTLAELEQLERGLFGEPVVETKGKPLQWSNISSDNHLMRTLKNATANAAVALSRQVRVLERDLKKAKKVFYG